MAGREWERFGEEIKRTVQNAIDSQDFEKLNQTITNTINSAVDSAAKGVKNARESINRNMNTSYGGAYRYMGKDRYSGGYNGGTRNQAGSQSINANGYQPQLPALYSRATSSKVGGIVLASVGYSLGACSLIALIIVGAVGAGTGFGLGFQITTALLVFLTAIFGTAAGIGTSMLGRLRRFRTYISAMQGKEYCDIKLLADSVRKSAKYVVRDVEKMIEKGWFRQGHLDHQKTCLMTSHQIYGQYVEMMEHEKQKQQEKERSLYEQQNRNLPEDVQRVIQTGDAFIEKIHKCNDAIPGEEISAKISHMEMLVQRIFDRVEENPENVADIRKLMDYYLPTTVKLLEAYEQLDAQPVQGENILSSKREIEKTLDTLNKAFEKLLDDLFQDTAWDVASDISVLHTMLAQEGLTGNDFGTTDN